MAVDTSKWKKEDLDAIAAAGAAWNNATTQAEKDAAHAQAEAVRAKYGYTGGADGSNLQPLKTSNTGTGTTGKKDSGWTPADISGNNYAQMAGMIDIHQAALDAAGKSWQEAYKTGNQDAMDAAHAQAEAIRALYGYSGGADGSQYIPILNAVPTYGGSEWDDVLDQAARELISMNYDDWTKGEQYQSLANRYGIQGKMSMQDVLGQISSRTGGLASSYATTAAQQQYNEYMSQLEEVARQMYSGERSDLLENAQLSQSLADRDYDRYLDSLDQYYTDRDYQFQNQKYADSMTAADKAEAQNSIYDYLVNQGGSVGELDAKLIAASGYTTSELNAMEAKYKQNQAAAAAKGTGSGTTGGPQESDRYSDVRKNAMGYDDPEDAEAYLNRMVDGGYITEDEAYNIFMVDLGGDVGDIGNTVSVPTTYEEFSAKTGYPGIMTESEFKRASGTGRTQGYANYQDYLAKMWEKYKPN